MQVKPKLAVCFSENCNKVTFSDVTGLWNDTTNTYGWSNTQVVGNLILGDIVTSGISFTKYGETTVAYTYKLKTTVSIDLFPTEATPDFDFADFDWAGSDGIYNIVYTGTFADPDIWTDFTDTILVTCKAECCIRSMWLNYFNTGNTDFKDKALFMEAELQSAIASFQCNNTTDAKNILNTLTKICQISEDAEGCVGCGA